MLFVCWFAELVCSPVLRWGGSERERMQTRQQNRAIDWGWSKGKVQIWGPSFVFALRHGASLT